MKALVVIMNCGKTNQHSRTEYGSALRHRDPKSCLVGALAFYFLSHRALFKSIPSDLKLSVRGESYPEHIMDSKSVPEPGDLNDGSISDSSAMGSTTALAGGRISSHG